MYTAAEHTLNKAAEQKQLKCHFIYHCHSSTITVEAFHIGKAIPLQAWTGLEGSRTLRLPDFKTIGT